MNSRKKKTYLFFVILTIGCFWYLRTKQTYTSYESALEGRVVTPVAGIQIKINEVDVVANNNGTLDNRVILDNTTWTSTHTREEKISPGSTGYIDLHLDPSGSEIAILYEFRFVDKKIDEDKLLTFAEIASSNSNLVKTANDTYSGIILLEDIQNQKVIDIRANFYFDYLNDLEGITEDNQVLDDLFEIHFHAVQYRGETLTEYIENSGG